MDTRIFLSVTKFTAFAHIVPPPARVVLGGESTIVCEPTWLSRSGKLSVLTITLFLRIILTLNILREKGIFNTNQLLDMFQPLYQTPEWGQVTL